VTAAPSPALIADSRSSAERGALRFVLFKPDLSHLVLDRIADPNVFSNKKLRQVFGAVQAVYEDGQEISPATVRRQLELGDIAAGFFNQLLVELDDDVSPISAPIAESHVDLLLDHFNTQRFRESAGRVRCWDDGMKLARDMLDWDAGVERDPPKASELWADAVKLQQEINSGKRRAGLSWGISALDKRAPLTPGLWLIAGTKKTGKSHVVTHLADHTVTLDEPLPVAVLSLEMSQMAFVRRLIARHTHIDSARIHRNVQLSDIETRKIMEDYAGIVEGDYPLSIMHSPGISLNGAIAAIRRWGFKNDVRNRGGLAIVDFLQQIVQDHRTETEALHLKRCAYRLADLGAELGIPIVAAIQFSLVAERAVDKARERKDYDIWRCPYTIAMIEGSGGPAQAAEGVLITDLLRRRDSDHRKQESDDQADMLLVLAEQRHGPGGGAVHCHLDLQTSRFTEVPAYEQDALPI
jgi:replicative DNA helicase